MSPGVTSDDGRLRVLLVPDSIHWVTGAIAREIAINNPWIEATIISGPVLARLARGTPLLPASFDLVHFLCPLASRDWLPKLARDVPVVTSHHHVTTWEHVAHNTSGDAIVTGSLEWAEDLAGRGVAHDHIITVPYGVDTRRFAPPSPSERSAARARVGLGTNGPVVGFFAKRSSNEGDRKGTDTFAQSVIALHAVIPQAEVLVVGPGWRDLVDDFRRRGIACRWVPHVTDPNDLPALYRALDFYWVTSRIEGGPVPLLEGMASGVCCLSTPVGLALEVIDDGVNGFLLPFGDSDAFADATASLWRDSTRMSAMGAAARATMVATMDIADTSRRYADAYATATRNFQRRIPEYSAPDVATMAEMASRDSALAPDEVPLAGIAPGMRKTVRLFESIEWADHLWLYHRGRMSAVRMLLRAWSENPVSIEPPRALLRRLLPTSVVAGIVRAKHALRRTSHPGRREATR